MKDRDVALMFVLVLVVCGALLYLDWRRQGEIEYLHSRFDSIEEQARRAMDAMRDRDTDKRPASVVDRILHASDDRTFADIARVGV